jgi:hypothetical protein
MRGNAPLPKTLVASWSHLVASEGAILLNAMTAAGVAVATAMGVVVSVIFWLIDELARLILRVVHHHQAPAVLTEREVVLSVRPVTVDVEVAPAKNPLSNGKVVRRDQ